MIENFIKLDSSTRLILFLATLLGVGGIYYRESLYGMTEAVLHREESSHGLFVPFISGYVLWHKFNKLKGIRPQANLLLGAIFLIIAILLRLYSHHTVSSLFLSLVSFLFVASALILFLFGPTILKEVLFPLFFLITMFPLPVNVYKVISEWMRAIDTWGSISLSKYLGVPLYREGYHVFLPESQVYIAKSCSGVRYLLSFITIGIIYASLFCTQLWARIVLILGSIPFAIGAGITRLTVIIVSAHYISPVMAEERPHIILSWIVFAVFLFGFITFGQNIAKRRNGKKRTGSS